MLWAAVMKIGMYSDSRVFLLGAYPTKEKATEVIDEKLSKIENLWEKWKEVQGTDGEWDVQKEHEKLFNLDSDMDWFPPKDPKEWKTIVDIIGKETILRVF